MYHFQTYMKTFFIDVVLPSSVVEESALAEPTLLVVVLLPKAPLLLTALLPTLALFDSAALLLLFACRLRQQKWIIR